MGSEMCIRDRYADDHNGVCLVFDRKTLEEQALNLFGEDNFWAGEVSYDREILEAGWGAFHFNYYDFVSDNLEYLMSHSRKWHSSLFFNKHEDWKGEDEWRIVTIAKNKGGCLMSFGEALKYVVVGNRTDSNTIRVIQKLYEGPVFQLKYEHWQEDCVLINT